MTTPVDISEARVTNWADRFEGAGSYETAEMLRALRTALTALENACEEYSQDLEELKAGRDALVKSYNDELDRCGEYLKDGETPSECIKRNREDANVVLGMLAKERTAHEATRAALTARDAELREAQQVVRDVMTDLSAANARLTARDKAAARWRHARQFLAIEDIERWSGHEWAGHHAAELESARADEAIDRAMEAK